MGSTFLLDSENLVTLGGVEEESKSKKRKLTKMSQPVGTDRGQN